MSKISVFSNAVFVPKIIRLFLVQMDLVSLARLVHRRAVAEINILHKINILAVNLPRTGVNAPCYIYKAP